jgi:hypothetical protein
MKYYLKRSFSITNTFLWAMVLLGLLITSCSHQQSSKESHKLREYKELTGKQKRLAGNEDRSMELYDGVQATLFAGDSMVVNPISMDIDTRGRIWVT